MGLGCHACSLWHLGGVLLQVCEEGAPTPALAVLHPPLSANEVLPKLPAAFKASTKKEAQTYSRTLLPEGSQRRTRRGPRPEAVMAASWPPTDLLAPHTLSRTHRAMPDCVPTMSPPPRPSQPAQLPGFVANTPPGPVPPPASLLRLLSRWGTNSPVLK